MKKLKIKIILVVALIISAVSFVVTSYAVIHEKKQSQSRIAESNKSILFTYEEGINNIVNFFTARANGFMQDKEISQAFLEKNHDALALLVEKRWQILQKENPHLIIFQFHNSDGTSLLRMHKPSLYGDEVAKHREIVREVHSKQKLLYGFEEGRGGFAFRVVVPSFLEGKYIGAVEFGVRAENFTQRIKSSTNFDALFFANSSLLGKFQAISSGIHIGDYVSLHMPQNLSAFFTQYKAEHATLENNFIEFKNHFYYLSTIHIHDHKGEDLGRLAFLNQMDDFYGYIKSITLASTLITIALILIISTFVNIAYNRISNKMNFQEIFNQIILDAIPSPIIVTNGKELIMANQAFLLYFKYKSVASFKKEHNCICDFFEDGDTNEYLLPKVNDQIWTEYIFENPTITHKAKITIDEKTTLFDVKLSSLQHNNEARYVVVFTDISSLMALSMNDSLTGIANRLHFGMVYEHLAAIAKREKSDLGMIFFDIDHFKKINDTYGHLTGDEVLKNISLLIKDKIRASDIFARWGGEEFILLLPDTSLYNTKIIAEGIRLLIANEDFGNGLKITCSFGVAVLREEESSHQLIKRIDSLLYEAKELGRNQVVS